MLVNRAEIILDERRRPLLNPTCILTVMPKVKSSLLCTTDKASGKFCFC